MMGKRKVVGLVLAVGLLTVLCTPGAVTAQQSRVFVTSEVLQADFGGLVGADAHCQRLGATVDPDATWVAWLSTNTVFAKYRLTATGPFVNAWQTDQKIADDLADLTDGELDAGICVWENGLPVSTERWVWTGTDSWGRGWDPSHDSVSCDDWTTAVDAESPRGRWGRACATSEVWTDWTRWTLAPPWDLHSCSDWYSLYCFEQAPITTGACCGATGGCEFLAEEACLSAGGAFRGLGTACETAGCPKREEPVPTAAPIGLALLVLMLLAGGSAFAHRRRLG